MERTDRPPSTRLKIANIRNKFSLLLAGRVGLAYHRFIGSSVHRFIGSSVHRFIGSSVHRFRELCALAQTTALTSYIILTA
ncbi:hypothetical protein [uncultured Ruegeria sp.]|uniref:hypothetical protein n=1 Tax=uncultured Ruegeria sp. TaxID=259304 RepID=UPI00260E7872|nr:hypothetical protein [uncultured Ruegeria sp.]